MQVDELKEVFETKYGFPVQSATLGFNNDPEKEAQRALQDLVYYEDCKRSLLIVYYAGHGYSEVFKAGTIMLTG